MAGCRIKYGLLQSCIACLRYGDQPNRCKHVAERAGCMRAVTGAVESGKSTLVAILTNGARGRPILDNGRGSARMAVFRHKHEIESGRTSSISQQVSLCGPHGNVCAATEQLKL